MSDVKRNPRDSMKSTWRTVSKRSWTIFHWPYEILSLHPSDVGKTPPVHDKSEKIAYLSNWQQQRWVMVHASIPLVLQQAYIFYFKTNFSPFVNFLWYAFWLHVIAIRELNAARRLGNEYGFLDGDKHQRDEVPDHSVFKVLLSLASTATLRPLMTTFLAYKMSESPSSLNWVLLPLEVGLYPVVLDFWFYWYHRLMHHVEYLWQFHRTHHLTKHPNPLLTLYADSEQEFFDIIGIPLMTYISMKFLGFPMGFYEWWICQQFVVYTELMGHSGLRLWATPPSPLYWVLSALDSELVIEDHDLHHRKGWKKSHNYGKQTRLWDRIFGTCADRIESHRDNIDYENRVTLPLI